MGEQRKRSTMLSPQDIFLLDQWGRQLGEAFGETAYLVGSVEQCKPDWRDVDVRMQVPFVDLEPLAMRTLNVAITLWGRQVTRLPIDFQFQYPGEFESFKAEDGHTRNPLGPRSKTGWRGHDPHYDPPHSQQADR